MYYVGTECDRGDLGHVGFTAFLSSFLLGRFENREYLRIQTFLVLKLALSYVVDNIVE
jgi:hypothetical protein